MVGYLTVDCMCRRSWGFVALLLVCEFINLVHLPVVTFHKKWKSWRVALCHVLRGRVCHVGKDSVRVCDTRMWCSYCFQERCAWNGTINWTQSITPSDIGNSFLFAKAVFRRKRWLGDFGVDLLCIDPILWNHFVIGHFEQRFFLSFRIGLVFSSFPVRCGSKRWKRNNWRKIRWAGETTQKAFAGNIGSQETPDSSVGEKTKC